MVSNNVTGSDILSTELKTGTKMSVRPKIAPIVKDGRAIRRAGKMLMSLVINSFQSVTILSGIDAPFSSSVFSSGSSFLAASCVLDRVLCLH